MKKLLCALAIAVAPAFVAYANDESKECKDHVKHGKLMKTVPDHMKEECEAWMSKEHAKKHHEEAKKHKKAAKKNEKAAKEAKEDAKEHHENVKEKSGY